MDLNLRHTPGCGTGWRRYQVHLQRTSRRRTMITRALARLTAAAAVVAVVWGAVLIWRLLTPAGPDTPPNAAPPVQLSRAELRELLRGRDVPSLEHAPIEVTGADAETAYLIESTLDPQLQQFLRNGLDRAHARRIGIVALEPENGKIRLLVGFDSDDPSAEACLSGGFPAASIFKIVTAAAAVETLSLEGASRLGFNGGKYTLYKSQIVDRHNRYTEEITLAEAFGQSVNPVFGKLGALDLGRETLARYAEAFGFNRELDFELPVDPSRLVLTDDPYQWAEVASGFNRTTHVSPLHAALIAATVCNRGRLVAPSIVERVLDPTGRQVYQSRPDTLAVAMAPDTAREVGRLMTATVRSGTARKAFRGHQRDRVLSRLTIGGKTGSINSDRIADLRYDWFTGYARNGDGPSLAIAVVVAHYKFIGTRAAAYARTVFTEYFRTRVDADTS